MAKLNEKNIAVPATENIRHSLKTLENTLNNMLMYAKGNADTFETVNCKKFSETIVNDILEYFPSFTISVRSDNALEDKFIKINKNALITSIRNLITNAQQVASNELEVLIDLSATADNKLNIRVEESEDWIKSINGFRRQVNRQINDMKKMVFNIYI